MLITDTYICCSDCSSNGHDYDDVNKSEQTDKWTMNDFAKHVLLIPPSASRVQRSESSVLEAKEIFRFQRRQQLTGIELKLSFRYRIDSRFAIAKAFGTQTTNRSFTMSILTDEIPESD